MLKAVRTLAVVFGVMMVSTVAMAQEAPAAAGAAASSGFSIPLLGSALIVVGAALGIGRIGGSAVESIARQPEYASKIQTAMIIAAALIEGLAFAALFAGK